jgi:hypothetical protein
MKWLDPRALTSALALLGLGVEEIIALTPLGASCDIRGLSDYQEAQPGRLEAVERSIETFRCLWGW